MVWESVRRFFQPVEIVFDQAILVAALGLIVNAASVIILGGHHPGGSGEEHDHDHHHHHDHNLRAAYLHVLADALTSILAIIALLAGKYLGAEWMDPAMGLVGATLVARWSWGLMRDASRILLDRQAPPEVLQAVREALESGGDDRVIDLHVWTIGPGIHAAAITIVTGSPHEPRHYAAKIPRFLHIVHATIEVHPVRGGSGRRPA
jgi:cation diffusion facilitator family transporter